MKKFWIVLLMIGIILSFNDFNKKDEDIVRFRVISNSNSKKDYESKIKVKKILTKEMKKDLEGCSSHDDTMLALKMNEDKYNKLVYNSLGNNNYKVSLGKNYFPAKEYNDKYYKSGKYDSLVVTLGKGEGKNFWCVLFPPLCFVENNNKKDIEYHFAIKDFIEKYILKR